MKLYLSGPMTGYENFNFPEFFRIGAKLRKLGAEVESPAEFDIQNGWVKAEAQLCNGTWITCNASLHSTSQQFRSCNEMNDRPHRFVETGAATYEEMLEKDCKLVQTCDGIVMMPGWEKSGGAQRELRAALDASIAVYLWIDKPGYLSAPLHPAKARRLLSEAVRNKENPNWRAELAITAPDWTINGNGTAYFSQTDEPMPHEKGGTKYDDGKTRWDLVPWDAVEKVAEILTFGAKKYGDRNWEQGIDFGRLFAATMRHVVAHVNGETIDPESGMPHLAHASTNQLMALALLIRADQGKTPDEWLAETKKMIEEVSGVHPVSQGGFKP